MPGDDFLSARDLIIGLSGKKSLIPESPKNGVRATSEHYRGDLRYFLLRLSESRGSTGGDRAGNNPVPVHGKRDGAGFLRFTRLPITGKI